MRHNRSNNCFKRCSFSPRAQSSIETLIILAIGLLILSILIGIVYDQLNSSFAVEQQRVASSAVRTLAKEIDDAYFLGPGTIKNVTIKLPEDVNFESSFIRNKSIVLNVGGTDVVADTSVDVNGVWPNTSGSFVFLITAFDDLVTVSVQPLNFSPSQINETLLQGTSKDIVVTVTNTSPSAINYSINQIFPEGSSLASSLSLSENALGISENSSTSFTATISCGASALGSYSGRINFVPNTSSLALLSVPINLVCVSAQTKLSVFPSSKSISAVVGVNKNDSVVVCNNTGAVMSSVSAQVTGAAASYVFPVFPISVPAYSCANLDLNIIPSSTVGSYNGSLKVSSAGINAFSNISLDVGSS